MGTNPGWGARTTYSQDVVLNVYDLHPANQWLQVGGVGVYHSGVEVGGYEYTFASDAGIFAHSPREGPGATFSHAVTIGKFEGGRKGIDDAIEALRSDFDGNSYNLITRNCNHFSEAFCQKLMGKEIPGYVNRLAYAGSYFSWIFDNEAFAQAPVTQGGSGSAGSGAGGSTRGSVITNGRSGGNFNAFGGSGASLGGGGSASSDGASKNNAEQMRLARLAKLSGGGGGGGS
ncbi:unnamed protein product [Chrysoparadoxa australica]